MGKELFKRAVRCPVLRMQRYLTSRMIVKVMMIMSPAENEKSMGEHLHQKKYFKDIFTEISEKPTPRPGSKMWWCKEAEGRKTCKWYERKRGVPGDVRHDNAPLCIGGAPVAAGCPPIAMCVNSATGFSSQARAGPTRRCRVS